MINSLSMFMRLRIPGGRYLMVSGTVDNEMRRRDRSISQDEAVSILETGEYGIVSTVSLEQEPYGVPVNYCMLNGHIYFHCALEGKKTDNIQGNDKVSFCVVGATEVLPGKFSTRYESSIVTGRACEVVDAEKLEALVGLLNKYSIEHRAEGMDYISKVESRARVFKIIPDAVTGKARR